MAANICELASTLPRLIGTLLDREAGLKKGRFREETLTDVLTASLAAFAGPQLVIERETRRSSYSADDRALLLGGTSRQSLWPA